MARAKALLANDPLRRWTAADALDTYNSARWGCGYFGVNDSGSLVVTPQGEGNGAIDMKELIDELVARGIQLPILLRFSDILKARIELLCDNEDIECPPTHVPRQEALCLAVLLGVRLIKVLPDGTPEPDVSARF